VLEPFITPALYQKYPGATDEWTLSTLMAADTASGGLNQLETHYQTFIVSLSWCIFVYKSFSCKQTEDDFAEMAGAGLNWVRMPIPFWAIDVFAGEPFLPRTCWK
jgi:glucan 1,3-beta-glucosidase